MNKIFKASIFAVAALATVSLTSCSDDDDDKKDNTVDPYANAEDLDYNSENAAAWGNYAVNVAKLLNDEFSFELVESSESDEAFTTQGTVDENGVITFNAITYMVPGTFNYEIRETGSTVDGITLDETVAHVSVIVELDPAGTNGASIATVYVDGNVVILQSFRLLTSKAPRLRMTTSTLNSANSPLSLQPMTTPGLSS